MQGEGRDGFYGNLVVAGEAREVAETGGEGRRRGWGS